MAKTLLALRQVRLPELLSDSLSAAQIASADTAFTTEEEYQQAIVSQIRRLIWGDNFSQHWNDDFIAAGVNTLQSLSLGCTFRAAVCQPTDTVGQMVYVSGNISFSLLQVEAVNITMAAKMPGVGMIVDKPTPTAALVQLTGQVDLTGAGLTAGRRYFVGYGSVPALLPPTPTAGSQVYVQAIGIALDANYLDLRPSLELLKLVGPPAPPPVAAPGYPFAMPFGPPVTGGSGPMP